MAAKFPKYQIEIIPILPCKLCKSKLVTSCNPHMPIIYAKLSLGNGKK